jgi:hypothetical protein
VHWELLTSTVYAPIMSDAFSMDGAEAGERAVADLMDSRDAFCVERLKYAPAAVPAPSFPSVTQGLRGCG